MNCVIDCPVKGGLICCRDCEKRGDCDASCLPLAGSSCMAEIMELYKKKNTGDR